MQVEVIACGALVGTEWEGLGKPKGLSSKVHLATANSRPVPQGQPIATAENWYPDADRNSPIRIFSR